MSLKEIALEVAKETDEYLSTKIAAPESWREIRDQELCKRFLAAVDAERGKAQLPVGFVDHGGIVYWHNKENKPPANDTQLFLSPTIPEGMALVPIEPTLDMGWAYLDAARESSPECEYVFSHPGYRAMIKAAGVTK